MPEIFHGSIDRRVNLKAGGVVLKWPANLESGRSLVEDDTSDKGRLKVDWSKVEEQELKFQIAGLGDAVLRVISSIILIYWPFLYYCQSIDTHQVTGSWNLQSDLSRQEKYVFQ